MSVLCGRPVRHEILLQLMVVRPNVKKLLTLYAEQVAERDRPQQWWLSRTSLQGPGGGQRLLRSPFRRHDGANLPRIAYNGPHQRLADALNVERLQP
jgi:hypothetical protein